MRIRTFQLILTAIILPAVPDAAKAGLRVPAQSRALTYRVTDTGQDKFYDNDGAIPPPKPGEPFYGQDAQFQKHPFSYALSADGLTVLDNNTGLTWQRSPNIEEGGEPASENKLTLAQARALPEKLNALKFGGFGDWRLPTIKELYSLFDARGIDPSGRSGSDTSGLTPFIDTTYFKFVYGDTSKGERIIDSQYASSTRYTGASPRGGEKLFGVNFADGRIKGYDLRMPGGREKTFFVLCVRGDPDYGKNDLADNGDKTITDRATGLMWSAADSGKGMNWEEALAWVQKKNQEKYLGHGDWRLPSVKELQSIVDYDRSPANGSAAISPLFKCTSMTNEGGKPDYPFYWSGTTHANTRGGGAAMYIAFGSAGGWLTARQLAGGPSGRGGISGAGGPGRGGRPIGPGGGPGRGAPPGLMGAPPSDGPIAPGRGGSGIAEPPPDELGGPDSGGPEQDLRQGSAAPEQAGSGYQLVDIHGAGAQRSDPKAGDPAEFPHGRGPQGDVIRIKNFVRLVRDAD